MLLVLNLDLPSRRNVCISGEWALQYIDPDEHKWQQNLSLIVVKCRPYMYIWPPSVKFDHGSTSWLSCLLDCCSVACGCID